MILIRAAVGFKCVSFTTLVDGLEITFANDVDKFVFTAIRELTFDAGKDGMIRYFIEYNLQKGD